MKNRIILIGAIILGTLVSQAQEKTSPTGATSFGLRAGVNFQNINAKDDNGQKIESDLLTGFHIGVNAEIPIGVDFYFQPGLLYSIKGSKTNDDIPPAFYDITVKISYLELPLNILYKPVLGNGRLLLGAGPYVAFGVGGEATYEGGGSTVTEKIKFQNTVASSDPNDVLYIRPIDAGINMLAGYEFSNRISFQLNTQLGLTKTNPEYEGFPNDKSSSKNTGFGVSLGYRF